MSRITTTSPPLFQVSAWIQNDGEEALQRFASVQLECEDTMKDHEQDFDKYYFISLVIC